MTCWINQCSLLSAKHLALDIWWNFQSDMNQIFEGFVMMVTYSFIYYVDIFINQINIYYVPVSCKAVNQATVLYMGGG